MDESDTDSEVEEFIDTFATLLAVHRLLTSSHEELLHKLQGLVTNIKWRPDDVSDLFKALLKRFDSNNQTNDRSRLLSWLLEMLHCIEIHLITPSWKHQTDGRKRSALELVRDTTITDENLKKYLADDKEKQLEEILEEIRQQNQIDEKLLDEVKDIVSSVAEDLKSHRDGSQRTGLKKDMLRLCQTATETHFTPRLTQMVSWCIMALSTTGQLIQVGTGEGKSCTVAMFAAFRAMRGEKVDILTSSSVLAERDLKVWKTFYDHLKISVDCNTDKHEKENLQECYKCQVVYGTVEKFAGDWLSQRFERMDIFGQRTFQVAIVDEVDSLMLDKGLNVVYISSNMPALQHLSPLLAFIWATVNQYRKIYSDKESIVKAAEAKIKQALCFTPFELSRGRTTCNPPGFLSALINTKLNLWIENALKAQTMTLCHEYIVEKHGVVPVDYSSTGVVENFRTMSDGLQQFLEMKHEAKLTDMTAITNYKSSVGLLQMYGCQIFGVSGTLGKQAETETLQGIYEGIKTCRIPTFKRRKLFEVEGVIIDDEKEWFQKITDVVTTQSRQNKRAVLVICGTINQAITVNRALGYKVPNKRLYISNNMNNSDVFKELHSGDVIIATNLAGRGADFLVSESVNAAGGLFVVLTFLPENARVEEQAFGRTARQGSPGSAQLIVCSSHLPEPLKLLALISQLGSLVEHMANDTSPYQNLFAMELSLHHRSHTDETSEALLSTLSHILTETSGSEIKTVKNIRDLHAAERLTSFSECDIPNIKKKEALFNQYLLERDRLYESSDNNPADSDLSALNEFWGMWLLMNFNENDSLKNLQSKLAKDLKTAKEKLKKRESPSSNLHHYTAFGNELRKKGQLAESINMYTKAIQEDHCWAAVAYYNRAFASLTQKNRRQDLNCIHQALQDLRSALQSIEFYNAQIEVTRRYSAKETWRDSNLIRSVRSDKHMRVKYEMLKYFEENMTEAIKRLEKTSITGGVVKVNKMSLESLIPPKYFLCPTVLSFHLLSKRRSKDPLQIHQLISDPSFDIFFERQGLESLGLTHIYSLDTLSTLHGFFSRMFW